MLNYKVGECWHIRVARRGHGGDRMASRSLLRLDSIKT